MGVLYLIALLTGFLAASLAVFVVAPSPSQLYELRGRRSSREETASIGSPIFKMLWPLLLVLLPFVRKLGSAKYREEKARDIPLAGLPPIVTVDHVLALKVVIAALAVLLVSSQMPSWRNPVMLSIVAVVGYFLPDRMITEQRKALEQKVVKSLPSAVDVLTLSVEAGMDFLSALQRVMEKGAKGPLRQEIATMINDIRLGDSRAGALRSFARRIDVPEVVSFVSILIQAEKLGASIGDTLRTQADRMRTERFQRAERAGAAATQRLLIPLVIFIFPAVMIVLIGPALLQFIYQTPSF